ncbi:MAG: hypothetical protein ACI8PT_001966 [Gammaproteobacteria bacterium]|jgi:hypothetical protein
MNTMPSKTFGAAYAAIFGIAVLSIPLGAQAANSWTFNTANCVGFSNTGVQGASSSGSCNQSSDTITRDYSSDAGTVASRVRVGGWANTGPFLPTAGEYDDNHLLRQGTITHYNSGGLGVDNQGSGNAIQYDSGEGSNPEHAIDNNGRTDMVLFDFEANGGNGSTWRLTDIEFGWYSGDLDISVLAWTGSGDPDLTQSYLDNCCSGIDTSLVADGWTVVGNFDVNGTGSSAYSVDLDGLTTIESGYWLVSAYSSAFGTCASGYCDEGDDAFKLKSIDGVTTPGTGNELPEPMTWLLLASGLPLVWRLKRK